MNICAISTPPGTGGIAVVRISGPDAITITDKIWKGKKLSQAKSHTAHLGHIIDPSSGETLDEAVATLFIAPRSFTGENVVELSIHGSRWIQKELLNLLCRTGCRIAEPGEFTRRAFLNGRFDLAQAEAVADVIASNSRASHRLAQLQMKGSFSRRLNNLRDQLTELAALMELELDFSEEHVEFASRDRLRTLATQLHDEITRLHHSFQAGNAIKEGIPVAIVGPTNAGKSSILNRLLADDRAIVSDIAGTTRDTIEETITLGDYTFRLIDTAGLRHTTDPIENIGINRSIAAAQKATILIAVTDASTLPSPSRSSTDTTTNHSKETTTGKDTIDAALSATLATIPSLHPDTHIIHLLNKADIKEISPISGHTDAPGHHSAITITISAKTGQGFEHLTRTLCRVADNILGPTTENELIVTNLRHTQALGEAAHSIATVIHGLDTGLPTDLVAQDLRETIHHLSTITGQITTPDILTTIFTRFCIGK